MAAAPSALGVLDAFGLSGEVSAYAEVAGGWSNRVLRLSTTRGDYAVKELRNAWGEPRWLEWLDEGWQVEHAAIEAGISAPAPVPTRAGDCVAYVERSDGSATVPVRLHRWVDAATVPREPVTPQLAMWLGSTLATQHALALQPLRAELYADRLGLTTAAVWPDLVERSRAADAVWGDALADAEPWARRATELLVDDGASTVLAHGDIDQKNLLVAADGPLLIDWDVVLPVVPSQDVAHAAVTMASWRDPEVAAAVLRGYRAAGGELTAPSPTDLGPALASRLGWIRFTVDRAVAARAAGVPPLPGARAAGQPPRAPEAGIQDLLTHHARRVTLAESWPTWLRSLR